MMQEDLQIYIDRCLLLNTPIVIDGLKCTYEKDILLVEGIEPSAFTVNLSGNTLVFPDFVEDICMKLRAYQDFLTFCVEHRVEVIDFNNVRTMKLDFGPILPRFTGTAVVTKIVANHWNNIIALYGFENVEEFYVDGITDMLLIPPIYTHIKVVSAKSVLKITSNTFRYITTLEELYIDNLEHMSSDYINKQHNFKQFVAPKLESLGSSFEGMTSLEYVDIGKVKEIKRNTFKNCEKLKTVVGKAVESVGDESFYGCKSLSELQFGLAKHIGYRSFSNCESLKRLVLGGLRRVEASMFSHSFALREILVHKDATIKADSATINFTFRVKVKRVCNGGVSSE